MMRIACVALAMGLMVGCVKGPEVPAAPAVGASDPAAAMKSMEDSMKAGAAQVGEAAPATGDAVKPAGDDATGTDWHRLALLKRPRTPLAIPPRLWVMRRPVQQT